MPIAAAFPNTYVSFTTKYDNLNVIRASDINAMQVEIEAIERALGTPSLLQGFPTLSARLDAMQSNFASGVAGVSSLNSIAGTLSVIQGTNVVISTSAIVSGGVVVVNVPSFPWPSLSGTPTEFTPSSGSTYYIRNSNGIALPQSASYNLLGSGGIAVAAGWALTLNVSGTASGLTIQTSGVSKFSVDPSGNSYQTGNQSIGGSFNAQTSGTQNIASSTVPFNNIYLKNIWITPDTSGTQSLGIIASSGSPSSGLYWGNQQVITTAILSGFGVSKATTSGSTLNLSPSSGIGQVNFDLNLTKNNTWASGITVQGDTLITTTQITSAETMSNVSQTLGIVWREALIPTSGITTWALSFKALGEVPSSGTPNTQNIAQTTTLSVVRNGQKLLRHNLIASTSGDYGAQTTSGGITQITFYSTIPSGTILQAEYRR
jgi:hypothetical protein